MKSESLVFDRARVFFEERKTLGMSLYCIGCSLLILSASLTISKVFSPSVGRPVDGSMVRVFAKVVVSPVLETIGFQLLPFLMARRLKFTLRPKLALMAIPFAVAHYHFGVAAVLNALLAGSILALAFLAWSEESPARAVQAAAIIHILHNLLASVLTAVGV